ncbi:Smoothelin [Clonorchis sinensis]|uniref:Smoothelin n=1 Tax=Clonorchis sinensis TaxID=79923 RepID=A0A8T1MD02_CLOSI|nr:Smoothelin [Clonorchis sinensis]
MEPVSFYSDYMTNIGFMLNIRLNSTKEALYRNQFVSAMNKFKAMDKANNPQGAKPNFTAGGRVGPGTAKEMMLNWCKMLTKDYPNVTITNFGSSWADGLAFCALIHHFYPDAFDYSKLSPENRKENFELAFDTAEKMGNIAPLLEISDLMRMKVPDWKCIFTQIQLYYRRFQLEEGKNCHVPPKGSIPKAASASS